MKLLDRTLSLNAESLWLKIEPQITTVVGYDILSEPAIPQVEFLPGNKALITISDNVSPREFEYLLFHELLHIWQIDSGFPMLSSVNRSDTQIAMMLNSFVLDENVNWILDEHKIHHSKTKVNQKYERLKVESKNPHESEFYYLIQCANIGLSGSTIKGDCLANLFLQTWTDFKLKYSDITHVMKHAKFQTLEDCAEVFHKLLEAMGLIERMKVITKIRHIKIF